ncbi:NAD(P)/FAD-dependent oxidoreductase [Streptomyces iranensis]|uniref:NAD(P)/FAD-dependent oxidoreductase n=1 Tax=Streptomyces iranensis TaxID=576784 RepID=UPI0039B73546
MRRAAVLGGSIAGLLAARVLSDHADEVVVLERDDVAVSGEFGSGQGPRPGVPQGTQMHALLDAGRRRIDHWFPGFSTELVAGGAALADTGTDVHSYLEGSLKVLVGGVEMVSATRPFLETHLRRRVLALDNLSQVNGRVQGLAFTGDRVNGVRYAGAAGDDVLSADLVVDATGRASRIAAWLREGGWPEPEMRRVHVDLGYATALFRHPEGPHGVTLAQSLATLPDGRLRLGTLGRVEGDRWIVLVAGYSEDRPGRSVEGFLRRCKEDPAAPFRQLAEDGEPIGEPVTYRHPDNRRRDFHLLDRFPAGLIAVGDTLASFNPIYGQGMSSATMHASCLATYLESGQSLRDPAWSYFKQVRAVVDDAWQTSVLNDLKLPHVTGPRPRGFKVASQLSDLIVKASVTDPVIHRRFLQVAHMLSPAKTLMRPGTLLRAAWAVRKQDTPAADTPLDTAA